jgi:hypothetical protein
VLSHAQRREGNGFVKQAGVLLAFAAILASVEAQAQTARDAQLMARAAGFVSGLPRGVIDAAVVDGPGAEGVLDLFQSGVRASGVTLNARRVPRAALASSGVRVIIVPEGQDASHAEIARAARAIGALTISTDMACVRAGHCVAGVVSQPRVEIVVSRSAAAEARIVFAQAFRVMIREIR